MMTTVTMKKNELRELEHRAARIRGLALEATSAAGSGHPTSCLSVADILAVLFFRVMRYHPQEPGDPANDRLVLSKGHAAPALYAAWVEAGLLGEAEIHTLRQPGSRLQGHPMPVLPFVDVATGSLGQGLSVGLGIALAQSRFRRSEARTFVVMGDGEIAEGAVWEAMALAAHLHLDNLIAIVDVNRLGQSGPTMAGHDLLGLAKKAEAFGWEAFTANGHDLADLDRVLGMAARVRGKPACVFARTTKGHGVSAVDNREGWHGKPIPAGEALAAALAEVRPHLMTTPPVPVIQRPVTRVQVQHRRGPLDRPDFALGQKVAPRAAFGQALVGLGRARTDVLALDADTRNSTFVELFFKEFPERSIDGFIAEQNVVGMAAGLASQGYTPVVATFGAFLGRAFDQIRMAVLSGLPLKLVGTHAGISIGEDGPSQMALEDLAAFRPLPGAVVLQPADAVSAHVLTQQLVSHAGPGYLRVARAALPVIYGNDETFAPGELKVVIDPPSPRLTVISGGVCLHEAIAAVDQLGLRRVVRVIDLYCLKPFPVAALRTLLAQGEPRVLVAEEHYPEGGIGEAVAANTVGILRDWRHLAVTRVPGSASPARQLAEHGLDANALAAAIRGMIS